MKPSSVFRSLNHLLDNHRPAFLWGAPGVGKSDVIAQIAAARKVELRDVRLNLLDPIDLRGFPMPNAAKNEMSWLPPDFLPAKGKGILFLDEFNSAAPATQAAGYQLMLNRRIGKYELPAGWDVICAGNRESDRSVTHRMPAALANRLIHVDYEIDLEDWIVWAMKNNISTSVIAFLRFRPGFLHEFDASKNPRAFPSPRSWAFASQIIDSNLPDNEEFELVKGTIGEGVAGEFIAFQRVMKDIPSKDAILKDPTGTPVPSQPNVLCAITSMLATHASKANFDKLMTFIGRLPIEFQVVFARDAYRRCEEVAETKAFSRWSVQNHEVMR